FNIAATVIDGWVDAGSARGVLPTLAALVVSLGLDLGLFVAVFVLLTSYPATVREILPGAILATILWQILQYAGSYVVQHEVSKASNTYGLFAIVLGTLVWLHIGAEATLYAVQLNVVRAKGLWPRALIGGGQDGAAIWHSCRVVRGPRRQHVLADPAANHLRRRPAGGRGSYCFTRTRPSS